MRDSGVCYETFEYTCCTAIVLFNSENLVEQAATIFILYIPKTKIGISHS